MSKGTRKDKNKQNWKMAPSDASPIFLEDCSAIGIKATRRQYKKWKCGCGLAYMGTTNV